MFYVYFVKKSLIGVFWVRDNDVMRGTLVFVETGGREKRVKPTWGQNL